MKRNGIRHLVIILIAVVLLLPFHGCSRGQEAERKPAAAGSEKKELPSELKSIRSELDKLIAQLEQTAMIMVDCPTSDDQSGEEEDSGGPEEPKEQGGDSASKQQSSGSSQEIWSQIGERVAKLHQDWNEAEAVVIKEGLSTDIRDKFENSLEELTISTDQRNVERSLFSALEVYRYYPEMVDLFESKIPAEYFRLRNAAMVIRYESGRTKWEEAQQEVPKLKTQWDIIEKNQAIENQQIRQKTENAVNDLENAVDKEEICLVEIKSDILMKNLEEIEKKLNASM